MIDLTVDTQILMVASGKGSWECEFCVSLIQRMGADQDICLALDNSSKNPDEVSSRIQAEYDQKLKDQDLGMLVLTVMASEGRLRFYKWMPTTKFKRIRLALEKKHFDTSDLKFVQTAAVSDTKHLVSEDDDYTPQVCKVLRGEAGVTVVSGKDAVDACANLCGGAGSSTACEPE